MTAGPAGNPALFNAVKEGLDNAAWGAGVIGDRLLETSHRLRLEHDEATIRGLAEEIGDLGHLVDLVAELRTGYRHVSPALPGDDPFAAWDRSMELFRAMQQALERKDWILLADLIRYELHPLLSDGGRAMADLKKSLE